MQTRQEQNCRKAEYYIKKRRVLYEIRQVFVCTHKART